MKYTAYFEKYRFDKNKNEIDYDLVPYTLDIKYKDYAPRRQQFWISLSRYFIAAILVLGLSLLLGFSSGVEDKSMTGIVMGIVFFSLIFGLGIISSIFGWSFDFEDNKQKEKYFETYYPNEYKELLQHNYTVFEERDIWRASHPFEEKVRKAMESHNSNDVAELIKYILEKDTV